MTNPRTISIPLAAAFIALAAPVHAQATRTHSFEGSCAMVGNATLADPMGLEPKQSSFEYEGAGTCQGALDEQTLPQSGAPIRFVSSGPRLTHTCELGYDPGITWAMTFYPRDPRQTTIVGTAEVVDVLRAQFLLLRGERAGIATGLNQLQGHMETLQRCAEGTISEGTVGGQLDTVTPLVSDEPIARGETDRPGPPAADRGPHGDGGLRLSVQPRRVRAGESARLRVRATSLIDGRRRPAGGAAIRLTGRRARTDHRGRASLLVRIRRAGRHWVTATLPTGATAATTIRVVRHAGANRLRG